jgi:hypothetical protein
MTHLINMAKRDLKEVRTIYGLLHADPDVLKREEEDVFGDQPQSQGWAKFVDITNI